MSHADALAVSCGCRSPTTHAREQGWSVAVFARNEGASIARCIEALARAARGHDLHVTVLLNGTTDDSAGRAAAALRAAGLRGRIYAIEEGDKANAFNQFAHHLRPPAATYFFVDAYAAVATDALCRLGAALDAAPHALAAAAVPSTGRSAARLRAQMAQHPGLHGSLFALRASFLDRLTTKGLRLPLGLYRGDGLVGAFVMHDLDAMGGGWRTERVAVDPQATWEAPSLRPWRLEDLRRYLRRMVQQGRGRLHWAAIRPAIYPGGFEALPEDADALALRWVDAAPENRPSIWRDPFAVLALAAMRRPRARGDLTPRLLLEVHAP